MLYKIGAVYNFQNSNKEKNKYLETVYENLNDKNIENLKQTTADYCSRFLSYNENEIEKLTKK